MALGALTDAEVNDLLGHYLTTPTWIGLAYDDPVGSRDDLVEVAGDGYERKMVTWRTTVRSLVNSEPLEWPNLPSSSLVTWVVGYTDSVAGRLRFATPLESPGYYGPSGVKFLLPVASVVLGIDIVVGG